MFKPTRSERYIGETGMWEISIKAPAALGFEHAAMVYLDGVQHHFYGLWQQRKIGISEIPGLTPSQRECLISGIGPQEWDEFTDIKWDISRGGDDA